MSYDAPEIVEKVLFRDVEDANFSVFDQKIGEPAIITMGAVIADATFYAVGAGVLHMPMTPESVREGIEKRRGARRNGVAGLIYGDFIVFV